MFKRIILSVCVAFGVALLAGSIAVRNVDAQTVDLTDEQAAWIAARGPVVVGNELDWPPFDFAENDKPMGFSIDVVRLVAAKTGMELEFVNGYAWPQLLEKFRRGEIDILPAIFATDERRAYMAFTEAYTTNPSILMVAEDDTETSRVEHLKGRRVAVIEGYASAEALTARFPEIEQLAVADEKHGLEAVSLGEADGFIGTRGVISYVLENNVIPNLRFAGYAGLKTKQESQLHMAVAKDRAMLRDILQTGLNAITPEEWRTLQNAWVKIGTATPTDRLASFTPEETAWLDRHEVIRVGADPAWPPYDFVDGDGLHQGLGAEYLQLLAKRLGVTFEFVPAPSWAQVLNAAKQREIDLVSLLELTPERQSYLSHTQRVLSIPWVVVAQQDFAPVASLRDLGRNKVGAVENFSVIEMAKLAYPDFSFHEVDSSLAGLHMVADGELDAMVETLAVAGHLISEHGLVELKIAGEVGLPPMNLGFGVRSDWPEPVTILNKALASISPTETAAIHDRWLRLKAPARAAAEAESNLHWWALGLVILLLAVMVAGYQALSRARGGEAIALLFGSQRFRVLVFALLSVFVAIVLVVGWLALERTKQRILADRRNNLETTLASSAERIDSWVERQKSYLSQLGHDPDLLAIAQRLVDGPSDAEQLYYADAQSRATAYFDQRREIIGHLEYFVVDPDGVNVASGSAQVLGQSNRVAQHRPELFRRVLAGHVEFVPPESIKVQDGTDEPPPMYFAAPIQNVRGTIVAAMLIEIDRAGAFSKLMRLSRTSETIETYAFSRDGWLLSPSRFDSHLRDIGLLEPGQLALNTLQVRDPGGNMVEGFKPDLPRARQPLTHAAADAMRRGSTGEGYAAGGDVYLSIASDVEGYRDYRGVPVFGAWLWQFDLGFGIVSEIDTDEALATYHLIRLTAAGMLCITLLLSIGGTVFTLSLGQRANRALLDARNELERQTQFQLDNLNSVVLRMSPNGTAIYINQYGQNLFGFAEDEIVGKPVVGTIVPETDLAGNDLASLMREIIDDPLKYENNENENLCKDSRRVWMLWRNLPVHDATGACTEILSVGIDITERKAAEKRLMENEQNLRRILESSPIGVSVTRADDGCYLYANSRLAEQFGTGVDQLLGTYSSARYADPEQRTPLLDRFRTDRFLVDAEVLLKRTDGSEFWALLSLSPFEYQGEPRVLAWHYDITERKRAEAEIAEKTQILGDVLDNIVQGVVKYDGDRNLLIWNKQFQDALQFPDGLMTVGRPARDLARHLAERGDYGASDADALVDQRLETLWSGDVIRSEIVIGDARDYDVLVQPTADGGLVITYTDITERKQAEQRLLSILQGSPTGIAIVDTSDSSIVFTNRRMADMFGIDESEVLDLHADDFYSDPSQREAVTTQFKRDGSITDVEVEMRRRDGETFFVLRSMFPFRYRDRSAVLAWNYDITHRKNAERALTEAYEVISSSIQYASRIQRSILPDERLFRTMFSDYFVHWEPRDVVGGDIYWCSRWGDGGVFMLGDCTGHGVPGAFMTLIAVGALDRAQIEVAEGDVAGLMRRMHQLVQVTVNQHTDSGESDDGMELGIFYLHPDRSKMTYVGARFSIFAVKNGDIEEIKGDRAGIGYRSIPHDQTYTEKVIELAPGQTFYMTSDGLIDQVGGDKCRSFGKRRFRKLISSLDGQAFAARRQKILDAFSAYQGEQSRRDDVAVMGFSVET